MTIQNYDFDRLKMRFRSMTNSEVMAEYAKLHNSIQDASDSYQRGEISESDFFGYLDSASEALDFLAGYLAGVYMESQGYVNSPNYRWFLCGM